MLFRAARETSWQPREPFHPIPLLMVVEDVEKLELLVQLLLLWREDLGSSSYLLRSLKW